MSAIDSIVIKKVGDTWQISQHGAAMLCDVTVQTMINWGKQDSSPLQDQKTKMYPLAELGKWIREEQIFKRGRGNSFPWIPDMSRFESGKTETNRPVLDEKNRLTQLQADKIEMDLSVRAEDLISVEHVRSAWQSIMTKIKTKLLKIPTAAAPLVHQVSDVYEIQNRLSSFVREVLEDLSKDWRSSDDGEKDDESDQ